MKAEFDAMNLARQITMKVKIKGIKKWTLRLRFAKWLIWVALWITGMGFELVEEGE